MRTTLRLGLSLLGDDSQPIKTYPLSRMSFDFDAVREAKEKFDLDLSRDVGSVALAEVIRAFTKVWPELLKKAEERVHFVETLDKASEEIFQNTVRQGEPDPLVEDFLERHDIRVVCDETTNTPEDVEANVLKGRIESMTKVIPSDADHVHAVWQSGERSGLCVSWYREPKDSPEWFGKGLGFCVQLDLEDVWGEHLASLINELWERSESMMSAVKRLDEKWDESTGSERCHLLEAVRNAVGLCSSTEESEKVTLPDESEEVQCSYYTVGSQVRCIGDLEGKVGKVLRVFTDKCDVKWSSGCVTCEPFKDLILL